MCHSNLPIDWFTKEMGPARSFSPEDIKEGKMEYYDGKIDGINALTNELLEGDQLSDEEKKRMCAVLEKLGIRNAARWRLTGRCE